MPTPITQYNETVLTTATIALNGSLSGAVRLPPGHVLVGIVMPADWTAADLTFQFSADGSTYQNAYEDDGTELGVTGTAAANIAVDPLFFRCAPFLKVRSGTAGSAVAQAAARSIGLVSRPM